MHARFTIQCVLDLEVEQVARLLTSPRPYVPTTIWRISLTVLPDVIEEDLSSLVLMNPTMFRLPQKMGAIQEMEMSLRACRRANNYLRKQRQDQTQCWETSLFSYTPPILLGELEAEDHDHIIGSQCLLVLAPIAVHWPSNSPGNRRLRTPMWRMKDQSWGCEPNLKKDVVSNQNKMFDDLE